MSSTIQTDSFGPISTVMIERLQKNRSTMMWTSIASIVLGIVCMIFPVITTWTLSAMVGWLMIFTGIVTFITAFSIAATGPFFGTMAIGLLKLVSGVVIIANPGVGAIVMTMIIAAVFMIDGATEMAFAFELRPHTGWGWIAISSLISIAAGVLIATSLPMSSLWLVGFLFGANCLSTGLAFLILTRRIKKISAI
jgi:uncharacterized membrane protein HdeD (DUF308 family)